MPRTLPAACLFVAVACAVLAAGTPAQQPADKKQPPGKYDPPESKKPDEATLKQIAEKTEQLRRAVADLKATKTWDSVLVEVEIYLKAAENVVRLGEWYSKESGNWTLATLDQGLARAKQAAGSKSPWRDARGRWVVRAYRSRVDDSVQPYAVLLPADYGADPKKKWRLDTVLHGRDSSLTETKFLAQHDGSKAVPKDLGYVQLEVYGRGNNAFRWAGETDVHEAGLAFLTAEIGRAGGDCPLDLGRTVLRGFSMGGAGTWHLGLHHPSDYSVIGPGAGFTTTHGYVGGLPARLPDYQEKCLHIYDAVDYAENAFNVPVVAYSGENDPQKGAADDIERALKGFKEPLRFTHLVAPGLKHEMPKEWQAKAEAEYRRYADVPRPPPERVRFVTYTLRYNRCAWVMLAGLGRHYEKAVFDGTWTRDGIDVTTTNITRLTLTADPRPFPEKIVIDGRAVTPAGPGGTKDYSRTFARNKGVWEYESNAALLARPATRHKYTGQQGPIDDAFMDPFVVVPPTGPAANEVAGRYAAVALERFAAEWDRYFRGQLPVAPAGKLRPGGDRNTVLFGDPVSNPLIAKVIPELPITWTKDELVVNGVTYDARTHVPVLIYPSRLLPANYVVLNSGHTFREADLKGTNALLYPRLGDWAVIKPTPTAKDPAVYEVVAAGLFDENWQFPKK